jgi:transcriptional regulator with XRE-family HTH domain
MYGFISDLLRELREEKKLSQGDIEKRTGLLRSYMSRVENGHTVPAIETLARASCFTSVIHPPEGRGVSLHTSSRLRSSRESRNWRNSRFIGRLIKL